MRLRTDVRKAVLAVVMLSGVMAVVGCGAMPPEVTALTKIGTGHIDSLSGTEIQAVTAVLGVQVELTEEQADAIAEFLAINELKTIEDIQALIDQAMADPESVELPEGFLEMFADVDLSGLEDQFLEE